MNKSHLILGRHESSAAKSGTDLRQEVNAGRNYKPLAGQRIGVFGRGGSGKSTCVVLLAKALAQASYAVCVVDADSTNEGLAQALGADKTPESLLDWLGGTVFSGGPVTCPVDDPVPIAGARVVSDQLPARS